MRIIHDRRGDDRISVRMKADVFDDIDYIAKVDITDFSHRGARIVLPASVKLPRQFRLRFDDGREAVVDRLWRIDDHIGVVFIQPPKDIISLIRSFEGAGDVLKWRTQNV